MELDFRSEYLSLRALALASSRPSPRPTASESAALMRRVALLRSAAASALPDLTEEEFSEFHFELDALEDAFMVGS